MKFFAITFTLLISAQFSFSEALTLKNTARILPTEPKTGDLYIKVYTDEQNSLVSFQRCVYNVKDSCFNLGLNETYTVQELESKSRGASQSFYLSLFSYVTITSITTYAGARLVAGPSTIGTGSGYGRTVGDALERLTQIVGGVLGFSASTAGFVLFANPIKYNRTRIDVNRSMKAVQEEADVHVNDIHRLISNLENLLN